MPAGRDQLWPEARDARLLALWAEGVSGERIGCELGVGKNAVIGRLNRLRKRLGEAAVPHRPSPIRGERRGGDGAVKAARVRSRPASWGSGVRIAPPEPAVSTLPPLAVLAGVVAPMAGAAPSAGAAVGGGQGCRYPLWGDCERPNGRFCDAAVVRAGCSWCAAHLAVVAQPQPLPRARSEAQVEADRALGARARQRWQERVGGVGKLAPGVDAPW